MPKYKVFYHNEQPPKDWMKALIEGRVNKHLEKFHEYYREVAEIEAQDVNLAWDKLNWDKPKNGPSITTYSNIRSMSVGDVLVNVNVPDVLIVCMPSGWENVTMPNVLKKESALRNRGGFRQ